MPTSNFHEINVDNKFTYESDLDIFTNKSELLTLYTRVMN